MTDLIIAVAALGGFVVGLLVGLVIGIECTARAVWSIIKHLTKENA